MAFLWVKNILRDNLKKQNVPIITIESDNKNEPEFDRTDKIVNISVRSIWIQHGALSGIGSVFTYPLIGQAIKHCWSEVQTNNGLYCVQFHGGANTILIHKKKSIEDAVKAAKIVGGMGADEEKQIHCIYPKKSLSEEKTMDDLKKFVESYAEIGKYDLVLNNCQDLSTALYHWCK